METDKILSRLTVKQKDFFFSFLKAESISFESILDLQSLEDIIKRLKDNYKTIEDSKSIKKWTELIDVQDRISGVWKIKRKRRSKVIIEGKNDNEVKHIIRQQNNIVSIIKILENKILPEVKIYNELLINSLSNSKKVIELKTDNERLTKKINDISSRYEGVNNELRIAHKTILDLKKKIKFKNGITSSQLEKIANSTRKKNGTLNYSAIGKHLGVSHHTAKQYCIENHIN